MRKNTQNNTKKGTIRNYAILTFIVLVVQAFLMLVGPLWMIRLLGWSTWIFAVVGVYWDYKLYCIHREERLQLAEYMEVLTFVAFLHEEIEAALATEHYSLEDTEFDVPEGDADVVRIFDLFKEWIEGGNHQNNGGRLFRCLVNLKELREKYELEAKRLQAL